MLECGVLFRTFVFMLKTQPKKQRIKSFSCNLQRTVNTCFVGHWLNVDEGR